jgi:hypothetical protein
LNLSTRLQRLTYDLTDEKVGHCVVLGLSEKRNRWNVRCSCGETFTAFGAVIRNAGHTYKCPTCRPRARRGVLGCGICGASGHNRLSCARRKHGSGSACSSCENLPWRRPVGKPCRCGLVYQAEPPVSLAEIMARPVRNPRELT